MKKGEEFVFKEKREVGKRGQWPGLCGLWTRNAHEQPASDADALGVCGDNNTERDQHSECGRERGEDVQSSLTRIRVDEPYLPVKMPNSILYYSC